MSSSDDGPSRCGPRTRYLTPPRRRGHGRRCDGRGARRLRLRRRHLYRVRRRPCAPFSSVAKAFHADCGLGGDAVEQRRAEDLAAVRTLGARALHLPFLDAIYRRHGARWLCRTARSTFDRELPDEPDLRTAITAEICQVVEEVRPVAIWTCSAIGHHVDHRRTRAATLAAGRDQGWEPVWWEGLPYAMGLAVGSDARPLRYTDVGEEHLDRKLAAIGKYTSQLKMLWPNRADWQGHVPRPRRQPTGMRRTRAAVACGDVASAAGAP